MRTFKKLLLMMVLGAVAFSCVEDDDFAVPETAPVNVDAPENLQPMAFVVDQIEQSNDEMVTFETENVFMEGYVISSDQAGNFFEELVLQDAVENPATGIKVLIDVNPLFTTYQVGQRVYVRLDGLTAGYSNGVPVLGIQGNGSIEKIAPARQDEVFLRDDDVFDIVPTMVTTNADLTRDRLLTLVQFPNVQFATADVGRSFAAEPDDQFDGLRLLQTCDDFFAAPIRLETSTFSDFKANRLFDGSGSVTAILGRDFEDDNFVISVNSLSDFDFDSEVRCNFDVVSCGTASGPGSNTILFEDFESENFGTAEPAGWTNYIQDGSVEFTVYDSFGTNASLGRSVNIGSFRSGDASSVAWLITPQIDFDAQMGEVFSFDSSNSFSDGSTLQVLYSADWDGTEANIETATWEPLADANVVSDSEFFGNWVSSGNVSLDCLSGAGYLAFKYEGSGEEETDGTYEIDNISVTSN